MLAPRGDGAISVDDSGQAHTHIPIWVPPGRAGIQPTLALEYSSGGGNSLLGVGWGLVGLSRITRCPTLRKNGKVAAPVQWNEGDSFCLDGEPLWADSDHWMYYPVHWDGSRIWRKRGALTEPGTWEMRTKDGRIITFGATPDSKVMVGNVLTASVPMTWAVSRVEDRAGNFMTVTYEPSAGGDIRPTRIDYTGSAADPTTKRAVTFTYETTVRPDVDQRAYGRQFTTYPDRLKSIEMHAPNSANMDPLRSVTFAYAQSDTTGRSLLKYLAECDGPPPSSLPVSGSTPLCRQQTFTYAPGVPLASVNAYTVETYDIYGKQIDDVGQTALSNTLLPSVRLLDVDGDGRDDLLYMSNEATPTYHLRFSQGNVFGPAIPTNIPAYTVNGPSPGDGPSAPLVLDFNGDGHADVLINQGQTSPNYAPKVRLYLANNAGGSWHLGGTGYEYLLFEPASIYNDAQTADLNGDGRPDIVMFAGTAARYSLNTDGTVPNMTPVAVLPIPDLTGFRQTLTSTYLDMNNDGVTDLMTSVWRDGACKYNKLGDGSCTCTKAGLGVFDIDTWLYPSFGSQPNVTDWAGGLEYCRTIDVGDTRDNPTYDHVFGDFNGDGIADAIQLFTNTDDSGNITSVDMSMLLGGGDQSFTEQYGAGPYNIPGNAAYQTLDADGDGKADLLVRGYGTTPYTVWSWKNKAWHGTPLLFGESAVTGWEHSAFTPGDVDGDGLADFVAIDGSGAVRLYRRNSGGTRADLLVTTTGDFTPATTVKYQPYHPTADEDRTDCVWPLSCIARTGYLVSEVDTDNGINGGTNAQVHMYSGGRADALGWGFLGFKIHTIVDLASGQVTTRKFDFTRNTAHETPFYPYVGHPTEVDTTIIYPSGGTSVHRTTTVTNQYEVQGNGFYSVNPTTTRIVTTETPSTLIGEQLITRSFDQYGNQTYERIQYPSVLEERDTTTTYYNDFNTWTIGRPTDVVVTSSTNVTITGATSQTRETSYSYDANGMLAVQTDEPNAQNDGVQTLYTRYTRNANGLPTLVERVDNLTSPTQRRATAFTYDGSEGMFVVQTTDPMGLVTQAAYEPGLGVMAAQTDEAGVLTTFQYDTFGRIRADHPAAGGGRTVVYHANGTIDDHRSGQYLTTSKLDSLRRTIQTKTTGRRDGKAVYVETGYDNLGRTVSVSRPHFAGVTAAQTVTSYDRLGRVTQVQGPDGSVQTTTYTGLSATTTNPDGNVSTITNDTRGRAVTSVQTIAPGHTTTTKLAYGPFDTLVSSTDTLGNPVQHTYDHLGRELWKRDADSGVTAHLYDVFGEATDEIRGAQMVAIIFGGHVRWVVSGGTDTHITYDADGRITSKATPDITQAFTFDATTGKLMDATITGGPAITYAYDTFGRVKSKTWAGPRGAIGYTYTYDSYNRPATTTYPKLSNGAKSLVVRNTYSGGDVGGELTKVDDVTTSTAVNYWTLSSTDASEQFPTVALRNGVTQTLAEDAAHPGWLNAITGKQGTTTIENLRYVREGAGRVHERDDLANHITETFGYDGVERLTSWQWNGNAGNRSVQYVYDDLGDLVQRNILAGPGTSMTYTIGGTGFGPHQAASDGTTTFQYDSEGNELTGSGHTFVWSSFDRLTSVTTSAGTYQMTYDADLARFSRTDPAGHTRYSYGPLFEELTDAAGTHDVLTVTANGKAVGEKEITNNAVSSAKTNALLTDALGSIDTIAMAASRQTIKYDPFGTRVTVLDPTVRVTTPPQDLRAGFTGHEHDDDTNLIDMIGRVYDPAQQRFLSVDRPAPDPVDSQAYNPYAYVRNNPLNATDPTGYYEVVLDGYSLGNDGQDAYAVPVSAMPIGTPRYGTQPATVQGSDGTAGPGTAIYETVRKALSPGQLTLDVGMFAPSEKASAEQVVDYFRMVAAMSDAAGKDLRPGAGWISPAQVAHWTEVLVHNRLCGSCLSAALLNADLAKWASIDTHSWIIQVNFWVLHPDLLLTDSESHAVATVAWNGQRLYLNAGEAMSASQFSDSMDSIRQRMGALWTDARAVEDRDTNYVFWSGPTSSWDSSPAMCHAADVVNTGIVDSDKAANPYKYDINVGYVRSVIGTAGDPITPLGQ